MKLHNCISWLVLTGVFTMTMAAGTASQDEVEVSAKIWPQQAEAGDVVDYFVAARWDPAKVGNISLRNKLSSDTLELLDFSAGDPKLLEDGRMEIQFRMRLLPLTDGTMQIPPAEVEYIPVGEEHSRVAQSGDVELQVALTPPSDPENPDIRVRLAQAAVTPDRTALYIMLAVGILLLALAAIIGWWIWRKLQLSERMKTREPQRPLEEIVQEQLDRLVRGDLLIQGKYKEFFLALSHIMRFYVGERFNMPALDMTSHELEEALSDRVNQELLDQLREFNGDCDLAKFAKHRPTNDRVDQLLGLARSWVRKTSPTLRDGVWVPSPHVKLLKTEIDPTTDGSFVTTTKEQRKEATV